MAFGTTEARAWGQKGHDVTCSIAERHLTKKAARKISEVLDGKSIVYWATWLDNASHTPEYSYTQTWHYKDIDPDETYETAVLCESGDCVTAINAQVEALRSGTLNKEAEALALKMLVHLVGDLHCPMHTGRKNDQGGNKWQVQFFNRGTNLHSVWDSDLVEASHKWTFTEWTDQIDRVDKKTAKALAEGTPDDWCKETHEIAEQIYGKTPVGSKISYNYIAESAPVIEDQLLRAGLRLASLLNEIYK
ncbi:MAG: S1/P1 nuclease [Bacteroidales bacterium]|nr:S1/P1 nuclease [Bacteroidales bacterium]